MATWHVRPDASHGGSNAGTSYTNAWQGWAAIVWASLAAGDTLLVHGTIAQNGSSLNVGAHNGSSSAPVTISGASEYAPGVLDLVGAFYYPGRNYTTTEDMTIRRSGTLGAVIYTNLAQSPVFRRCDISGGNNGITFDASIAFQNLTVEDCYIHDIGGTRGSSGRGIAHLPTGASLTFRNYVIRGNRIERCADLAIRLSVETGGFDTSVFDGVTVEDNICTGNGGGVWVRSGYSDTTTQNVVFSSGLNIRRNVVRSNGVPAGSSTGALGGITFSGFRAPKCYSNEVSDVYVSGAGIQTAKNIYPLVWDNDISGVRSGSALSAYQSGLPIDGNGIFFDNLTQGGAAWGNRVRNLVSTGLTNSGTAYSFWDCNGATFMGNVAIDCYRGASYGRSVEYGNRLINNTFVRCAVGVTKIGTDATAGNLTARNNLFVDCPEAFNIGTNPSIDENYSMISGSATAYTGISQGANSQVVSDPLLDSSYRPREGSPCIGAGTYIAGARHMGGKRMSVVFPDIGAYRYEPLRAIDLNRPIS